MPTYDLKLDDIDTKAVLNERISKMIMGKAASLSSIVEHSSEQVGRPSEERTNHIEEHVHQFHISALRMTSIKEIKILEEVIGDEKKMNEGGEKHCSAAKKSNVDIEAKDDMINTPFSSQTRLGIEIMENIAMDDETRYPKMKIQMH